MAFAVVQNSLPAQTAGGATSTTMVGDVPTQEAQATFQPTKLSLTSPSLVTGVATNNATFNFRQMRAGVSQATIGTLTLGSGTNLAAEVETNVPITGAPILLPGDVVDVQMVQNGTGLVIPVGVIAKAEMA